MTIHAYKLDEWTIHPSSNEVIGKGRTRRLESRVMQLLVYFCQHPNRVISQAELTQAIWGRTALSANSLSVAVAALRHALDDDVRNPRYIETHKKLGYRLRVAPRRFEATLRAEHAKRWQLAAFMAALIAVAVGMWLWSGQQTHIATEPLPIRLGAIDNSTGSAAHDELAEILGDLLIAELARYDGIAVKKAVPAELARVLAIQGNEDDATAYLSGRVLDQGGELVLAMHLEEEATATILWADKAAIDEDRLLADLARIAGNMIRSLNLTESAAGTHAHEMTEAEALYRQARELAGIVSNVTIKLAHDLLTDAVLLDPEHGPAHALLAELYSWHYPTSFWGLEGDRYELAERQLALAYRLGADEAYLLVTRAGILLARDRDYEGARELLGEAAQMRPHDPWVLRPQIWANMLLGDFDTALEYNLRAAEASLDPRSVLLERIVPLYYLERFDEALELHEATVGLGLKPSFQGPQAAIMLGKQAAGFRHWVQLIRHSGVDIEDESEPLAWIAEGDVRSAYDWLRDRAGEFREDWNYALASAGWHVACGDHEQAVTEISRAIHRYRSRQEPGGNPSYAWALFLQDPLFAGVRADPRMATSLALLKNGAKVTISYDNWPEVTGPYLGQEPPGMTAEIFAPGIVSTEGSEINSVFTPDGDEFYFTAWTRETGTKIMVTRRIDGRWTAPQAASFSTHDSDVDLAISYDGRWVFFGTRRPRPGETETRKSGFDMWFADRRGMGWGEAQYLGSVVNSGQSQVYPSVTRDGTLYFQAIREDGYGKADVYRSRFRDGVYQEPENLGPIINSENYEGDVFIAPDESYLIVSIYGRRDSMGEGDLYISFRSNDGSWSPPKNLGMAVNSDKRDFCPMVTPDGRYLFFSSKRAGEGDIFWVDARVIEALRDTGSRQGES